MRWCDLHGVGDFGERGVDVVYYVVAMGGKIPLWCLWIKLIDVNSGATQLSSSMHQLPAKCQIAYHLCISYYN